MAKEKFILVSLNEDESKKLAQIVSNDTARKILDFLADTEATETEIAEKIGIPISTAHYNLQALVKGRLVEADKFHYSEKGKEVLHYRLANKYIIIAPKSTFGIREKLRSILPVGIIALATAGIIQIVSQVAQKPMVNAAAGPMLKAAVREETLEAAPVAMELAQDAVQSAPQAVEIVSKTQIGLWFLLGAVFVIVVFIVVELIRAAIKSKQQ
jgi:DNA-binding transcriptional ArsR family regulator